MKRVFFFGAHQVKIIGYSLSRLEVKLCSYSWEKISLFTKLEKTRHNMCQFINNNNVYGSKVVGHIIIKSIIIFGSFMPWKRKVDQGLGLRSPKKSIANI